MKAETKYLTRRHLEAYSEIQLSKLLLNRGYMTFFPFKDKGIDMVAVKGSIIGLYQLKARNEMRNYKDQYWFSIKKNLDKLLNFENKERIFFILCALQPNQKYFHFFKIPLEVAKQYFIEKRAKNPQFFEIRRLNDNRYEIIPKYVRIDINKYRLK